MDKIGGDFLPTLYAFRHTRSTLLQDFREIPMLFIQ